ncbi:SusE domain-containing protein [Belliella sp. DSM 111904]|uniref:SusE domain-containing protein n=1 Tax=Belliella filtrata TaxID=2923435 RepID=A0ABS9V041_9BACT|nr:SusE domain-containing protein [Belliella filtrata]MCH7409781.1 SusE domain-containing protein [Belliella filtrata]
MKKFIYQAFLMALAMMTLVVSCTEDDGMIHTQVTPVQALYSPDNNAFFNLGAQSSVAFEWQAALAADNGVVLYEVVFDLEDGDFSEPVYVMPADGRGLQRRLSLPFAELNSIAQLAGIGPEERGRLKWTVRSSKGINVQPSEVSRVIEVLRPAGFPAPDELYLTGTATEAGDSVDEAILMKRIGTNSFEVFTRLNSGTYQFIDRKSENAFSFYVEGDRLRSEGITEFQGEEGIYRIRLNFSGGTVQMHTIEKMELWFAPDGVFLFELPYDQAGVWLEENRTIAFKQESWGRDERYKFRLSVRDSNGQPQEEWFGSSNADNQRPTADTNASYWYMLPTSDDRWNHSFKFQTEVDNSPVDIRVIFNAEVSNYTHQITIR